MITPKELMGKSGKLFLKIVQAVLRNEQPFPLVIPANKNLSETGFSELKAAIVPLHQYSKQAKGKGYTIEWKEKRVDGTKQKLPTKIYFETLEDYLFYTKREVDYRSIQNAFTKLNNTFPNLVEWAKNNISFLLTFATILPDLIKVCQYFQQNKPPHLLYLRELPITVHSKFIEDNTAPLKKLLDQVLPPDWINKKETDFLNRYSVKKPNVYAQIRILDTDLKAAVGFNELALTLEDSALLTWNPAKVFIIENKACFLSFPAVKNAVAIFGEGFKSRVSKHIPWLANTSIYCWFDLDAAGFEMLNTIRKYYPGARNLMMDKATYDQFKQFAVTSAYRKLQLDKLTTDEVRLYEFLQTNNIRLEHERIAQQYVQERLSHL